MLEPTPEVLYRVYCAFERPSYIGFLVDPVPTSLTGRQTEGLGGPRLPTRTLDPTGNLLLDHPRRFLPFRGLNVDSAPYKLTDWANFR